MGVALEQALGRLLVEGEELPGGGADEGEAVLDPPHLALVPQPVLADELELLVEPGLLEGPPGRGLDLAVLRRAPRVVPHRHHPELPERVSCHRFMLLRNPDLMLYCSHYYH